jgi:transcriptional regulator with XRE-family HTH domain
MENLGSQLKAARQAQNVTLKTLAQKSGVHWVTLSRFENGRADLGVRKLNRVAQALGLELTVRPTIQGYTLDDLAGGFLHVTTPKANALNQRRPLLKQVRGLRR